MKNKLSIFGRPLAALTLCLWICAYHSHGQTGNPFVIQSIQKISDTQGNFQAQLDNFDSFGIGLDTIGDLDGNGVIDAYRDPGGVTNWSEVMAVRISLLVNSVEAASAVPAAYTYFPAESSPIAPPTDDFRLRQEFSSLVSIRNSVL